MGSDVTRASGAVPPPAAPRRLVAYSDVLTVLAWEQLSGGIATVDEMLILTMVGESGVEQEYVATVAEVRAPFDAAMDREAVTFEHMEITRGRVVAGEFSFTVTFCANLAYSLTRSPSHL